jgi:hypothetical protein
LHPLESPERPGKTIQYPAHPEIIRLAYLTKNTQEPETMKQFKGDKMNQLRKDNFYRSFSTYTEYTHYQINKKLNIVNALYTAAAHSSGKERSKIKLQIFALAKEIQEAQASINNDILQEVA